MNIAYVEPDHAQEVDVFKNLEDEVRNHPDVEIMTVKEFVEKFNDEQISDQGVVATVEERIITLVYQRLHLKSQYDIWNFSSFQQAKLFIEKRLKDQGRWRSWMGELRLDRFEDSINEYLGEFDEQFTIHERAVEQIWKNANEN